MAQRYWILTIPEADFSPGPLFDGITWAKGQLEEGQGGFRHWQLVLGWRRPVRLAAVKKLFPTAHAEPTRSAAADEYVWKDETSLGGRFEIGEKALRRNVATDWQVVRARAQSGDLASIPDDIFVRHYGNLRRIAGIKFFLGF